MKLLIIGGTRFLGRHLAELALAAGHEVTLFNRGRSNPGLFPGAEEIHGDRDGGLDALAGRRWDAAIDTCGYVPRLVGAAARFLADRVDHYTFISSVSVYADPSLPDQDESAPLATVSDPAVESVTAGTYGGLKVLCEQAAEAAMPGRVLSVRSGLIVGAHDTSDRYTYWPERVARGGEVLAPAPARRRVQYIDVRDLSRWILRMAGAWQAGVYNAAGRAETLGELLDTCRTVSGSDARCTWVPDAFLQEQGVGIWNELPLWVPVSMGGMIVVNQDRALAAGLTLRPAAETAAHTLAWAAARPAGGERRAGLKPEKEAAVLAAWHERGTGQGATEQNRMRRRGGESGERR